MFELITFKFYPHCPTFYVLSIILRTKHRSANRVRIKWIQCHFIAKSSGIISVVAIYVAKAQVGLQAVHSLMIFYPQDRPADAKGWKEAKRVDQIWYYMMAAISFSASQFCQDTAKWFLYDLTCPITVKYLK